VELVHYWLLFLLNCCASLKREGLKKTHYNKEY
jgi:hypothetical protein